MATYYAWSKFKKEVNEWGRVLKWINPGDKISKSDLGLDDREWENLIEVGAVREEPYPDIPDHMSPAEYYRANPPEDVSASVEAKAEPTPNTPPVEENKQADGNQEEEQKPGWLNK